MTATNEQVIKNDDKLKGYLASIPICYPEYSGIAHQFVELYVRDTNTDPHTICNNGMEVVYSHLKKKEKEKEDADDETQTWREVPETNPPKYDVWADWDPQKEEWISKIVMKDEECNNCTVV